MERWADSRDTIFIARRVCLPRRIFAGGGGGDISATTVAVVGGRVTFLAQTHTNKDATSVRAWPSDALIAHIQEALSRLPRDQVI